MTMSARDDAPTSGTPRQHQAAEAQDRRPQPVPSESLLRGRQLVEIAHNGEVYRLQATRLGKLILTN